MCWCASTASKTKTKTKNVYFNVVFVALQVTISMYSNIVKTIQTIRNNTYADQISIGEKYNNDQLLISFQHWAQGKKTTMLI